MNVELLLAISGTIASITYGFWLVASWAVKQFERRLDERFATQEQARNEGRKLWEERVSRVESEHRALERQFLEHLASMPEKYQRREDTIRFETVINAKLDALYSEMRLLSERQTVRVA